MTLLYSGLAWLGGVALAEWLAQPMLLWLLVGGLAALAAALLRARPRARVALGLVAVAALGAARTQSAQPAWGNPAFLSHHNGAGFVPQDSRPLRQSSDERERGTVRPIRWGWAP